MFVFADICLYENNVLERNTNGAVVNRFYRGGGGRLIRSERHG